MLGLLGPRFLRSTFSSLFVGLGPVLGALMEVIVGPLGPLRLSGLLASGLLALGLLTWLMLGPTLDPSELSVLEAMLPPLGSTYLGAVLCDPPPPPLVGADLVGADLPSLFLPAIYPAPAAAPAIPTTDFLALLKSSCLG